MKLKSRIRELLTNAVKTRQWLMDNGYGANDLPRKEAITKIKKVMELYSDKDDSAHVKMVVQLKREINRIMPGYQSRSKKLRSSLRTMIEYCEQHHVPQF